MDLLLRLVAIAATFVFLAATAVMLLTFRRARRVTTASLLVPVLVSAAILVLYCVFLRATPSVGWLATALATGAALGATWARSHTLFRARDGGVRSRASLWYLGVWAAVLTLNQLVVLAAGHASTVLVGLLVFSTGIAAGNGLMLLRRVRILKAAAALALAALGSAAGADDVLLLLPREFDVKPTRGWSRNGSDERKFTARDLEGDPPFRFRGEEVTQENSSVDVHTGNDCPVEIRYHHEYRASFRRGTLSGTWKTYQRNFYRGCKHYPDGEYMRVNHQATVTGRAEADGRLSVTVQVVDSECLDNGAGGWVRRNQDFDRWSFGFEFQLPVGELQSNQKLSAAADTGPDPGAARQREARPGDPKWEAGVRSRSVGRARGAPRHDRRQRGRRGETGGRRGRRTIGSCGRRGARRGAGGRRAARLAGRGRGSRRRRGGAEPPGSRGHARVERRAAGRSAEPAARRRPRAAFRPGAERRRRASRDGRGVGRRPQAWIGPEYARSRRARSAPEVQRAQGSEREPSPRRAVGEDVERGPARVRGEAARRGAREAEAARLFALEAVAAARDRSSPTSRPGRTVSRPGLEWAEYGADTGVSLLGELTGPAGQKLGRIYTVTKETVKGTSEGVAAYARGQGGALAEEGSAWVIAERAGIGLAKGGAKVGLDDAAGKVMEGVAKLGCGSIPELPDLGEADLVDVVGEVASGAGEGATRRAVGIAVGKTAVSQVVQAPAGMAVKAATGEEL